MVSFRSAATGKGFRGLAAYLLRNGRGQIVAGPMAGRTPRELAAEFGLLRRLNPKLGKAVAHFSLSPSPEDAALSDEQWQAIAERFMDEMGFAHAPWCGVVHRDTDHTHLHLMACRIDASGKTVSDANDFRRAEAAIRRIEADFGLAAVASPQRKKARASPSGTKELTNPEENPMPDTTPPNPFDPSDPQHATWPEPFEPGRDLAELAIIETTASVVVPGASCPDELPERKRREMRRLTVEEAYWQQVQTLFGADVTRVFKHSRGAVLYFRGPGRIADSGDRLTALGGMPDELAAKRIVALALSPERAWKSITFTGSARFVELAMREAMAAQLVIHASGPEQQAILSRLEAEKRGGMGAMAAPVDPILAPLAELDDLPAQTWPRTAPNPKPVPSPATPAPASPATPPQPTQPVVGVLPGFLNLRERLKDRRQSRAPVAPAPSQPTAPKKPGAP